MSTNKQYDVAIIGSGIAGSTLGAILARHGQRVVIFEAKQHPRFSIGESMILETSEVMRALAELYDVPELAYFSSENFFCNISTSHGVKRHFSFLHHQPNTPHDPRRTIQAIIPKEPHGHELHLFRQDTDYFMVTTAVKYGATVLQNTPVTAIDVTNDSVSIVTGDGSRYNAAYVVDAGGFRSLLADQFDVRTTDLLTQSRAIFTHMVNLPGYNAATDTHYDVPFPIEEGTLHHVFEGGWLWVIPFNNHSKATNPLVSVGLMLDPRLHPLREDQTPEAEFYDFINQYPAIAAQFAGASAVREWTRTGRIQYSSTQIVGERWALLGHAAGFIDPLYSKGLYTSLATVSVLAHLLLKAQTSGDYSRAAFLPLEDLTLRYIHTADRLVANSYKAFGSEALWPVYCSLWLLGAYTELVKLISIRIQAEGDRAAYYEAFQQLALAGGGFAPFTEVAAEIDALMAAVDPHNAADVARTVAAMRDRLRSVEWMPAAFKAIMEGATHLPKGKLRLSLLRNQTGFMGHGAYRQHFFGDNSTLRMVQTFISEKLRYDALTLNWRRRRKERRKRQAPLHKLPQG